jgi:hypothetical protein
MSRVIRLTVGAAVILFAGAALAQPAKDADGYFPIKPNTKWIYKVGDQTVEVKVVGKESYNGEECTKIETWVGGKAVASELYSIKADGVYRVKVKDDKIDPAIKVLPLPIGKNGDAWKFSSKVGTQSVAGEFKIKDIKEKVKVPAGEFEAVAVEGNELDVAGTKTTVRLWFVKDKGIVKLSYKIAESDSVLELTKVEIP